MLHENRENRAEQAAVEELVPGTIPEVHAAAGIEKQVAAQVGFLFEFADEQIVGAAVDFPIDTLWGIAGEESSVGGELLAAAGVRAAV